MLSHKLEFKQIYLGTDLKRHEAKPMKGRGRPPKPKVQEEKKESNILREGTDQEKLDKLNQDLKKAMDLDDPKEILKCKNKISALKTRIK